MIEPGQAPRAAAGPPLAVLSEGRLKVLGLMPDCSNYTFLVRASSAGRRMLAVYKPQRGEAPLHDFPYGSLCLRERAAYLVSVALGWDLVPPTVMRQTAPMGAGSLQLFIDADPREHYFTLAPGRRKLFMRFALFDYIINNADRKSGHCLLDGDGHIWGVDHGLSFHALPKLRTVIWDYAGETVPPDLVEQVGGLAGRLAGSEPWVEEFCALLGTDEVRAFKQRITAIADAPIFPEPPSQRSYPWPPI
jgi:uncharacterized repeat protein (TIGR03843 family)